MPTNQRREGPILLVEPNINRVTRRFGLPAVANYPPLAQVRLAGQINAENIRILDLRILKERKQFVKTIRESQPALVGISLTFTSNGDEATQLASNIRKASPETIIVLGGTGASEDPASFYESEVDFIGFRRCDASLNLLVQNMRATGQKPESPPGFLVRTNNGQWELGNSVDSTPMEALKPYAWHLLPKYYWKHYFQGYRPTGIGQMSEGCPFDCTFCSVWKVHGRSINIASLANAQHDLLSLPTFVRAFFFADDIWMQANESQLKSLHDPLLEWISSEFLPSHQSFWFTAETRTDVFLRQEARFQLWAREGGLQRILFGIEAVTDSQLDDFSKRTTVDINSLAIEKAANLGIFVTAQFVIPCEADQAYFDELAHFLKEHRQIINVSNFTIATPLPGTELYDNLLEKHAELADRNVVTHPAFSLFTALSPTQMNTNDFYEQVARIHQVANQFKLDWTAIENLGSVALRSPWLLPNILKMPFHLNGLTRPETFLDTHREVQGERVFT